MTPADSASASHGRPALGHAWRALLCLTGAALLSACAGQKPAVITDNTPVLSPPQEAAIYKSHAHATYAPPGPPGDPWGPYVTEASTRFDVPPVWIREVMHVESGGYQYRANGTLTTSPVGAMGLMQLMPATYDEMRVRYNLGDDAFEPHDNILAGTAYLREMYDAFGSPGFLAAYNAGPSRLADYLANHRALPDETRRYVYLIGSRIGGAWPQSRSPADQLALNQIPVSIPPGPRYARHTIMVASRGQHGRHEAVVMVAANTRPANHAGSRWSHAHGTMTQAPVEVAEAPEPRRAPVVVAAAAHTVVATSRSSHGLHLIEPAMASESVHIGGHNWAVQIGSSGRHGSHATVPHTRLGGLTHDAAVQACHRLSHKGSSCLLVAPSSQ